MSTSDNTGAIHGKVVITVIIVYYIVHWNGVLF